MTQKPQLINGLRQDERAVSPVIGVILMVAITVILAAVIGTFVLDLGQSVGETGPTASMSFSDVDHNYDPSASSDEDAFLIEHQGGDEFDLEDMRIVIRNESSNGITLDWNGASGKSTETGQWTLEYNDGNNITSGATQTMSSGDVILLKVQPASGQPDDDFDYKLSLIDTNSDNTVGAATVQLK